MIKEAVASSLDDSGAKYVHLREMLSYKFCCSKSRPNVNVMCTQDRNDNHVSEEE